MELRSLRAAIRSEIEAEALKLSNRHHSYHNRVQLDHARMQRQMKVVPPKVIHKPAHWKKSRLFNPFYVHKHAPAIANSIATKLRNGAYAPSPPATKQVAKDDGNLRTVNIFQIPDAAVSRLFHKRLDEKNRHRFSGYSYAYRRDRNLNFAIQDISVELRRVPRLFVAEFDFSEFFDRISHAHLLAQLDRNGFLVSPLDKHVIQAFLSLQQDDQGVPQGTSISLFLANLVCWELDYNLERHGVKFARYADDTVVWTTDYAKICSAVTSIHEFSEASGIPINYKKSRGVRLLTPEEHPAELAQSTSEIEFLGYSLGIRKTGLRTSVVQRIKADIGRILHYNLILPLSGGSLNAVTIPSNGEDRDLLSAIMQVRRYIYGNLSESTLRAFLSGATGRIPFKGALASFPLVDDVGQLSALDGWLCSAVFRAVRRRGMLLETKWGFSRWGNFPFDVKRAEVVARYRAVKVGGAKWRLYEIPSFMRLYRTIYDARMDVGIVGGRSTGGYH